MQQKHKTSGVKYLGSKASFIDEILGCVNSVAEPSGWVALDVFMGSSRVAQSFRQQGYVTLTSELLPAGEAYSHTYICNPTCDRVMLNEIIQSLNNVQPVEGWLTQHYGEAAPAKDTGTGKLVNAFTRDNAMKADAIRDTIELLKPELQHWEYMTLITSLIMALNKVQNSQGHSRAFFREFMKQCLQPITLELPNLLGDESIVCDDETFISQYPVGDHFSGDVLSQHYVTWVKERTAGKRIVAYMDPPYTANLQYNQFYHLWDSIVLWDKPSVVGATNRREDRSATSEKSPAFESLWAKRKTAKLAFEQLFGALSFVDAIVLSYSDESIVTYDEMVQLFDSAGFVLQDVTNKRYQRHALSKTATASQETRQTAHSHNTEWIFLATRRE